ncbi:hypothetical protein ACP70R_008554 [Stipagrostis hirtigluma subsp. patula]
MVVASDIEHMIYRRGTEEGLEQHNGGTKEEFAVEADLLENKTKIFRFPSNLRRIGAERDYIAPRTVAIGPYYRREPELQAMEEVKRKAVNYFFQESAQEREATYQKIIPIARKARNYYADTHVLDGIPEDEFASIMFIDGCFLVQFIDYMIRASAETSWFASMIQPYMIGITRDMMLLENQIPWPVIKFFTALRPLMMGQIIGFVTSCLSGRILSKGSFVLDIDQDYQPSHLLCLTRSCIVGRKRAMDAPFFPDETVQAYTSAMELAEMGIKLKPTNNTQLSDMNIVEDSFFFATLSLPPLSLDSIGACWLVNMAAFEMWTEASWTDDCSINSYLAVMSLLMSQEDDIGELRARRIIQGLSNHRALEFFDGLEPGLCPGRAYYRLIIGLAEYKHKRRVWIAIYRILYNHIRTIIKVVSVVGVLVGIFTDIMADDTTATTPARVRQLQLSKNVATRDINVQDTVINIGGNWEELRPDVRMQQIKSKIHRFPSSLRRFGTEGDYIVPRTVALGPYYNGKPELQAMEEVKSAVVGYFFLELGVSQQATYERFKPIAREARVYYADTKVLEGIPDDEFTAMMFADGCFLVQYMDHMVNLRGETSWLRSMFHAHYLGIERDMLLLENQIPWPVIEFFTSLREPSLLGDIIIYMFASLGTSLSKEHLFLDINKSYRPPHLLGLLVFYLVGSGKQALEIPTSSKASRGRPGFSGALSVIESFHISEKQPLKEMQVTTSAAELKEMGIKLKASKSMRLSDIGITEEGPLIANLSIPPWSMHSVQACWLVNMAAFEICTATGFNDEYHVNSYICIISLLMNQEEDVHELRVKHILQSFFGNKQTLEFIKGMAPNLSPGPAYGRFIADLATYKHRRRLRIAIYRFFYNNAKTVAAVLPIIGVLVGIFKTVLSLEQKQQ